jgi:hypothetical protein
MIEDRGRRSVVARLMMLVLLIAAGAPLANAQSGIAGLVKDASGAVLPGVTVEASSPALIEGARSTISDESGKYNIVSLRAGTYTVTFSLPGFRTVKREGIELPTSFTATVNVQLEVGGIADQLTVVGESPLVDVINAAAQTVMNRAMRDAIPTGKDPFAVGQLIAGVTTSTPDVGGTQIMQQPTLQVHGSSNSDNVFMVDGVQMQHIGFGGNQTGFYFNDGLMDEINYQTSTLAAEAPVGGVQINMIPHDGGNQFHGSAFVSGANEKMQSDNLDDNLVKLDFKKQNRVQSLYDANFTLGGPVKKDRLWFFGTYRRWAANNFLGNTFTSAGDQAVDDQHISDATLRLTLQASRQHKFAIHYDRSWKWRGHRPNNWVSASINDPISDVVQTTQLNYIGELKWTGTFSNRLVADAAIFTMPVNYRLSFEPDAAPDVLATYDQVFSTITGVAPRQDSNEARMYTYATSVSYLTRSHTFKLGFQSRTGWSEEQFFIRGDILQITSSGSPNSVRLVNTPSGHKEEGTNSGVYFQDSWRIGRVTLNPGIRYERFVMSIPAQSAPAGRWAPARTFEAQNGIVNWNTFSPRFGFAWDMFGDGRTALKGGLSRYDRLAGITVVQPLNLRNIAYQTCPWSDTSKDLKAQVDEIDMARCTGSLVPALGYVDDNLKRPHQWEYNVMLQRQVGANTSFSAAYYGRRYMDLYTSVNSLVPSTAYSPVTITNPVTGEPLTVYNQDQATRGQVRSVLTTIPDLRQWYNGVEFQINARLSKITMFGGFTIGKSYGDQDSGDLNNPNNRINNRGNVGFDSTYQVRSGFSYRAPYRMQLSGSIREASGLPQNRNYTVTTTVVPGLTQVTQSIQVVPRGEYRYPWTNLVDFRVVRVFKTENVKVEPTLDLYNLFNSNAITNAVTTVGTSLGRPSAIVMGRLLRLGFHMTF